MKKFFLSLALATIVSLGFSTNVVPVDQAMKASKNFLSERVGAQDAKGITLKHVYTEFNEDGTPVFYRFQVGDNGFMIVSATDLATPVLAYSLEGEFKEGTSAEYMMDKYKNQLSYVIEHPQYALKESQLWDKYLSNEFSLSASKSAKKTPYVEPLVTTTWTQETYYNTYCPISSQPQSSMDYRTPVGCVALTMTNLMYYYRYPSKGTGGVTYIPKEYDDNNELIYTYPVQSVAFSQHTYNYDAMSNSLSSYTGELAKLLYHAGVSTRMSYGSDGSGTTSSYAVDALQDYFSFSSNSQYVAITDVVTDNTQSQLWIDTATAELDAYRPIYFSGQSQSGGGHAWIVDGYTTLYDTVYTVSEGDTVETVTSQTYFHVNWGWAGSNNGYYLLTNQYGGSSYGNFNYNSSEAMILKMAPEDSLITKPTTGETRTTAAKGTISDGAGNQKYQPNTNRSWVIACPNATAYTLKFSKLKVKSGDKVTIYNGGTSASSVLAEYSGDYLMAACTNYANLNNGGIQADYEGQTLPSAVTVNQDSVLVVFTSNSDDDTDYGFVLDYEATVNQSNICSSITVIDTDVWNDILTDKANNEISDDNYPANVVCQWRLRVPEAAGYAMNFRKFDLKAGDFVEFYDNTSNSMEFIERYDVNNMPTDIFNLNCSRVVVKFVADNWVEGSGFELEFYKIAGIDDYSGIENVTIYPNPATSYINVAIEAEDAQDFTATIVDMTGKTVYTEQLSFCGGEQVYSIPVSGMANGFYFLNLQSKQGKTVRKFIVE